MVDMKASDVSSAISDAFHRHFHVALEGSQTVEEAIAFCANNAAQVLVLYLEAEGFRFDASNHSPDEVAS